MNIHLDAGDETLHLPFVVNVRDMSDTQVESLLDDISETLNGKYFRTKELLMDVLSDQRESASKPYNFLHGPYIGAVPKENGTTRMTSMEKVEGGFTVYAEDQITSLLSKVREERSLDKESPNEGFSP